MSDQRPRSWWSRRVLPAGVLLVAIGFPCSSALVLPSTVHAGYVHGYTRKDGTYVHPYYRRSPTGGSLHLPTTEKRSPEARREFMKSHPCPSTGKTSGACPGYVVDHIMPLKRGGADAPYNMQWQTIEGGKAKDKWE